MKTVYQLLEEHGLTREMTCKDFVLKKYPKAFCIKDNDNLFKICYKKKVYDDKQDKVITIDKCLNKKPFIKEENAWINAVEQILKIK